MKNKKKIEGEVLRFSFLKGDIINALGSLFWKEIGGQEDTALLIDNSTYFLFQSEIATKNGVEFHKKRIITGKMNDIKKMDAVMVRDKYLKISPSYFMSEEYVGIYEIVSIQSVDIFAEQLRWLLQQRDVDIKITCATIDEIDIQHKLDRLLKYTKAMQTGKKTFVEKYYQVEETKIELVITKYLEQKATLISCRIFIKISKKTKIALSEAKGYIIKALEQYQTKVEPFIFKQKTAIEHFFLSRDDMTTGRIIMLSNQALSKILPLTNIGLFDSTGKHIGWDMYENPIFFDIWEKTDRRVNSNFIILGQSGQGKTTLLKTLVRCNQEDTFFLLDPENEYHDSFQENQHIVYEIDPRNYFSDSFQIGSFSEEGILFLQHHFSEQTHASYSCQQLFVHHLAMYRKENGRTLDGFYVYLIKQHNIDTTIIFYIEHLMQRIPVQIKDIQSKQLSRFVLREVMDISSKETTILLYEMLYAIWKKMLEVQNQRKFLVIDESYLLFSRDNYIVAELLRNIIKRARKYNVSVGIISQNIVDFEQPEMKHLLSPIFDTCTYKFLFFQGEKDFEIISKLCRISEEVKVDFMKLKRGECMLVVGTQYGKVTVKKYD